MSSLKDDIAEIKTLLGKHIDKSNEQHTSIMTNNATMVEQMKNFAKYNYANDAKIKEIDGEIKILNRWKWGQTSALGASILGFVKHITGL